MIADSSTFDAVFGKQSSGESPEQRAVTSQCRFVRSQHQLSVYREGAIGRVVNAQEALRMVGWESLRGLADNSAIPLLVRSDEPYQSIDKQLQNLGLSLNEVARKVRWSNEITRKFELRKQVPFRELERLARTLGLESDKLGIAVDAGADIETGVRLRTYRNSDPKRFTVSTVLGLAETAWTIQKQFDLAKLIGQHDEGVIRRLGFEPSAEYGSPLTKTYQEGYRLAQKTRQLLNIPADKPIASVKELIEARLCIPVIQLEIHSELAGATISSDSYRGIAINLKGDNSNPLVRRMTMAHELGHLLWDPDQRLNRLVVDQYDSIIRDAVTFASPLDAVERRANAFAIEFLAPGDAIVRLFNDAGGAASGLEKVITTFGVSKTAIVNHLMNASHNKIDLSEQGLPSISTDEWEAAESLAVPLFDPQTVPVSRRGRFSYYVLKAYEDQRISDDTASSLYQCQRSELARALNSTRNYVIS
jgi:Zn-dependent peptidase ImmA (M78 family)